VIGVAKNVTTFAIIGRQKDMYNLNAARTHDCIVLDTHGWEGDEASLHSARLGVDLRRAVFG